VHGMQRTWAEVLSKFCFETLKGRENSEDLSVDGRIILKRSKENMVWNVDGIRLAHSRDRLALGNAVMSLCAP
jgi:hypothetical protein